MVVEAGQTSFLSAYPDCWIGRVGLALNRNFNLLSRGSVPWVAAKREGTDAAQAKHVRMRYGFCHITWLCLTSSSMALKSEV